jgi:hypothetical protein
VVDGLCFPPLPPHPSFYLLLSPCGPLATLDRWDVGWLSSFREYGGISKWSGASGAQGSCRSTYLLLSFISRDALGHGMYGLEWAVSLHFTEMFVMLECQCLLNTGIGQFSIYFQLSKGFCDCTLWFRHDNPHIPYKQLQWYTFQSIGILAPEHYCSCDSPILNWIRGCQSCICLPACSRHVNKCCIWLLSHLQVQSHVRSRCVGILVNVSVSQPLGSPFWWVVVKQQFALKQLFQCTCVVSSSIFGQLCLPRGQTVSFACDRNKLCFSYLWHCTCFLQPARFFWFFGSVDMYTSVPGTLSPAVHELTYCSHCLRASAGAICYVGIFEVFPKVLDRNVSIMSSSPRHVLQRFTVTAIFAGVSGWVGGCKSFPGTLSPAVHIWFYMQFKCCQVHNTMCVWLISRQAMHECNFKFRSTICSVQCTAFNCSVCFQYNIPQPPILLWQIGSVDTHPRSGQVVANGRDSFVLVTWGDAHHYLQSAPDDRLSMSPGNRGVQDWIGGSGTKGFHPGLGHEGLEQIKAPVVFCRVASLEASVIGCSTRIGLSLSVFVHHYNIVQLIVPQHLMHQVCRVGGFDANTVHNQKLFNNIELDTVVHLHADSQPVHTRVLLMCKWQCEHCRHVHLFRWIHKCNSVVRVSRSSPPSLPWVGGFCAKSVPGTLSPSVHICSRQANMHNCKCTYRIWNPQFSGQVHSDSQPVHTRVLLMCKWQCEHCRHVHLLRWIHKCNSVVRCSRSSPPSLPWVGGLCAKSVPGTLSPSVHICSIQANMHDCKCTHRIWNPHLSGQLHSDSQPVHTRVLLTCKWQCDVLTSNHKNLPSASAGEKGVRVRLFCAGIWESLRFPVLCCCHFLLHLVNGVMMLVGGGQFLGHGNNLRAKGNRKTSRFQGWGSPLEKSYFGAGRFCVCGVWGSLLLGWGHGGYCFCRNWFGVACECMAALIQGWGPHAVRLCFGVGASRLSFAPRTLVFGHFSWA